VPTQLRSLILAFVAALSVAACFSGPSLNRPPYRYNEPVPAAPAPPPAKGDSTPAPEKKQSEPAAAPIAPLPPATPPATPGG
jgi:hypothetical protein